MSENKNHHSHHPGLFFPLLLIAIGLILLLQNLGLLSNNIWDILWNCWPVLLIVIGLDSLLKRHGVAGPVFFIGLGAIFLLSNFDLLAWNTWDLLFQLWPVMLIAWGLDLVIGHRSWWGSLLALVLLALILAGVFALGNVITPAETEQISWEPNERITLLNASLKPAVGSLNIEALSDNKNIVEGTINYRQGTTIEKEMSERNGTATFSLVLSGNTIINPINQTSLPDWNIDLATSMLLDLDVSVGVGDADLDLEKLSLENLNVDVGVGRCEIILPAADLTANINGGVGETVIYLPKDTTVSLIKDTGITSVSLPADFTKAREDEYKYNATQNDLPQITLYVEQGIGRLEIKFTK